MRETYICPDHREVLLEFDEDTLKVQAMSREGMPIGMWQFRLLNAEGEAIDLMAATGEAVSFRLSETNLADAWHHQGITERVMTLVADEISISPAVDHP